MPDIIRWPDSPAPSVRLYFELPFPTASCWLRPGLTIATMAIAACLLLCNAVAALLWPALWPTQSHPCVSPGQRALQLHSTLPSPFHPRDTAAAGLASGRHRHHCPGPAVSPARTLPLAGWLGGIQPASTFVPASSSRPGRGQGVH